MRERGKNEGGGRRGSHVPASERRREGTGDADTAREETARDGRGGVKRCGRCKWVAKAVLGARQMEEE